MSELKLAASLTAKTSPLFIGLEQRAADIYDLVTPVNAELLRWWLGDDACQSWRFNFHPGPRCAIPNLIVAAGQPELARPLSTRVSRRAA